MAETQRPQLLRQLRAGRLAHAAGGRARVAEEDAAVEEGARREHHRVAGKHRAIGELDAAQIARPLGPQKLRRHAFAQGEPRRRLQQGPRGAAVLHLVGLSPGTAHRHAAAAVEDAEVDARRVNEPPHDAAQRVQLADHVPLPDPADGGIAAHLADGREVERQQRRRHAHAGRHMGRFYASVAAADDDEVGQGSSEPTIIRSEGSHPKLNFPDHGTAPDP